MSTELIVIEQLPIITERLQTLGAEIDKRIADALALECSEENKQTVKKERTALSKDFEVLEQRRKTVKTAILTPYEKFEEIYKQYVSDKYKDADAKLKKKIDTVEVEQKKRMEDKARSYFSEYAESKGIVFVKFEQSGIKVSLSDNDTKLRKLCTAFIDRIADDLALIETQENKAEILVEYEKSLNCSQAITEVTKRHKAIEEQKQRQIEQDAAKQVQQAAVARVDAVVSASLPTPTASPAMPSQPISELPMIYSVKITCTKEKAKAFKKFLDDGGYDYE